MGVLKNETEEKFEIVCIKLWILKSNKAFKTFQFTPKISKVPWKGALLYLPLAGRGRGVTPQNPTFSFWAGLLQQTHKDFEWTFMKFNWGSLLLTNMLTWPLPLETRWRRGRIWQVWSASWAQHLSWRRAPTLFLSPAEANFSSVTVALKTVKK